MGEAGLAHDAPGHQSPGDAHPQTLGLQRLGLGLVIACMQLAGHDITPEVVRKGDAAGLTQLGKLGPTLGNLFVLVQFSHVNKVRAANSSIHNSKFTIQNCVLKARS